MKCHILTIAVACLAYINAENVRLLDLDPTEAQQILDKQDQTLNYAPKIETNVPAVRYLGEEPHHVLEDIYLAKQYHGQDGLGGYLYGYNVPDISKTERKKASGDLRGAYNYIAGNGQEIKVEYWDDGTGFHQVDNVPKIQPKQVEDSPEVKAAKEEHLRRWKEEAERNSKPIANPYNSEGQYASTPQVQYEQQQPQYQPQYQQQQQPQPQYQLQQPQYQQQAQYQNHQQLQPQYQQQQGQYQQTQQQQPNPYKAYSQSLSAVSSNGISDPYSGQFSQNNNIYAQQQQGQQPQQQRNKEEDEEPQGPPRGFFYSFDYPVGIIVSKQGRADVQGVQKSGAQLQDIYNQNKQQFEQQLRAGHGIGQQYSYSH